ncbi:MAG: hypothetical protein ACD_74C00267G0001 [uncultured bacterium]|nr:MAG: hypothetical protein ACD_74C00267G0001 [uncultured bacterium]
MRTVPVASVMEVLLPCSSQVMALILPWLSFLLTMCWLASMVYSVAAPTGSMNFVTPPE